MNIWMKCRDAALSVFFSVAVFSFFMFFYPAHLHAQENLQLFLYSWSFSPMAFSLPGGFSNYLGRFFVQFFVSSGAGAVIISLLLLLLQWAVAKMASMKGSPYYPLSFLPSLALVAMLCNENYMLSGVISTLLMALFCVAYSSVKQSAWRLWGALLLLPFSYWIMGGAYLGLVLYIIGVEFFSKNKRALLPIACMVLLSCVLPLFAKQINLQYPVARLFIGVEFFRFLDGATVQYWLPIALSVVLFFLTKMLPVPVTDVKKTICWSSLSVLMLIVGVLAVRSLADMKQESVMEYDYLVSKQEWNKIIRKAEKEKPTTVMELSMLNLALGKRNLLGENLFSYNQIGTAGLLPSFVQAHNVLRMESEIYFHLGFVNTAQRYAFEAMETIPDHQKSARALKRLAETNIINGNYKVAAKYLGLLKQTLFYRAWAKDAETYLFNDDMVNAHKQWGMLRKWKPEDDFIFDEERGDEMLLKLFQYNAQNKLAYDYLLAYCMLSKNNERFLSAFSWGEDFYSKGIPKNYQEAVIYAWGRINPTQARNIPFPVDASVTSRMVQYATTFSKAGKEQAEAALTADFSDTYWFYLQFRRI